MHGLGNDDGDHLYQSLLLSSKQGSAAVQFRTKHLYTLMPCFAYEMHERYDVEGTTWFLPHQS